MCKSHQFTVRHLFDCENCHVPVSTDDVGYDSENNWCAECRAEYLEAEMIDHYGRWRGEKIAEWILDQEAKP